MISVPTLKQIRLAMRLLTLLLWTALTSAMPLLASAQETGTSTLERIKTTQTVRVCVWPDYYGISFLSPILVAP